MKKCTLLLLFFIVTNVTGQSVNNFKTIHVFVALCDNDYQGIVPVPRHLGNGQDAKNNLYWGALYGMKTHFKRSNDWQLIRILKTENDKILERVLFKHISTSTFLLADAYDGRYIKQTTIDFLNASGGDNEQRIEYDGVELNFGGGAGLIAYIGHNGLMEFGIDEVFKSCEKDKDAIVLACISKDYFSPFLKQTKANPLVWSTGLMAPEAYTLDAAIAGWIHIESDFKIRERAAQAYHKYQKCGINGARNLLVTGF